MRGRIIFFVLIGLLILLLLVSLITAPSRISWRENFSRTNQQPYGTFVLHDLIGDLYPDAEMTISNEEVYYVFTEKFQTNQGYLIINQRFIPDEFDLEELIWFIEEGNHAFIAAREFSYEMADTLGFEVIDGTGEYGLSLQRPSDSTNVRFLNPQLADLHSYDLKKSDESGGFAILDTAGIEVLATNHFQTPCLIRIGMGKGSLILCSAPRMLSNYHLLHRNDHEFAATALSYLPATLDTLIWDEYYKDSPSSRRNRNNNEDNDLEEDQPGLLSYINSQPPLRWAFWIFFGMMILYAFFESKRKQRTIPIKQPLPNATLEFTETVGRLYYESQDHKNVAEKKIKMLLSFIRTNYFMQIPSFQQQERNMSPQFIETLSGKTGMHRGELIQLFRLVSRIKSQEQISESTLLELNLLIETFYQTATHGRDTP